MDVNNIREIFFVSDYFSLDWIILSVGLVVKVGRNQAIYSLINWLLSPKEWEDKSAKIGTVAVFVVVKNRNYSRACRYPFSFLQWEDVHSSGVPGITESGFVSVLPVKQAEVVHSVSLVKVSLLCEHRNRLNLKGRQQAERAGHLWGASRDQSWKRENLKTNSN